MTRKRWLVVAWMAALVLQGGIANAGSVNRTTSDVFLFVDPSMVIPGASSTVVTNASQASMTMHTSDLPGGDAVTVWWVVFNTPEGCTDHAEGFRCGPGDLFNSAADASVIFAAGHVVGEDGVANWGAALKTGDTSGALFGPGLVNPLGADIHLVVRDHGPLDPMLMPEEIHSFGVCNPACVDLQASVHEQ